jgi:hypothetical protein
MITIPTYELTGLISDVLAFADPDKKGRFHGILLEWSEDDYTLYASAFAGPMAGRSSWTPGDGREGDTDTDDDAPITIETFGGSDSDWRVFISYEDAKEIVKVFKLPAKKWWVPVAIKVSPTGSRLTIERTGDHGPTEALLSARTDDEALSRFPNIEDVATATRGRQQSPPASVLFTAHRLAAFGSVRFHGDLVLTFGADGDPVSAGMGSRFVGFIFTAGTNSAKAAAAVQASAGNILRHGSGLVTTDRALEELGDGPIAEQVPA